MSWRDLLQQGERPLVYPWTGGRELRVDSGRRWSVDGDLPTEIGWSAFESHGRRARYVSPASVLEPMAVLEPRHRVCGYLAGDRLISEGAMPRRATELVRAAERVHLLDAGLDLFTRVSASRMHASGPLVFAGLEMPLGPESDVLDAYLDAAASVEEVRNVTPALDAAFRFASWLRAEQQRRQAEAARLRAEEEARRARDELRRELVARLGDGAGRRDLAGVDFCAAARAALAIGGAELLDTRPGVLGREQIVRFRLNGRRFECTCHATTLQIIDSGICLRAETDDDGFDEGTEADTWLTLESLPATILDAERQGRLVVFRHV